MDERGYIPIHYPSESNHIATAVLLVKKGADIDPKTDSRKYMPLHLICRLDTRLSPSFYSTMVPIRQQIAAFEIIA